MFAARNVLIGVTTSHPSVRETAAASTHTAAGRRAW